MHHQALHISIFSTHFRKVLLIEFHEASYFTKLMIQILLINPGLVYQN